jgi:Transposase, Mutator family
VRSTRPDQQSTGSRRPAAVLTGYSCSSPLIRWTCWRTRHQAGPEARRAGQSPDHRDGRPLLGDLPGGDEVPSHRPRGPDRLPAVPRRHHHRIRHSNFIERTFGETRRRNKVIGRLPGETSCLTLVWARPGPGIPRLARPDHDRQRPPPAAGSAPLAARPAPPAPATHRNTQPGR